MENNCEESMYFLFFLIKRLLGTITMSMTELFEDSVRFNAESPRETGRGAQTQETSGPGNRFPGTELQSAGQPQS